MYYYASDYRAKLRAHMNKLEKKWKKACKGEEQPIPESFRQEHIKEFKYPFPENVTPWDVRERFALEEYFMGEGISGTVFERYSGFFQKGSVKLTDLAKIAPYRKMSDDEKQDKYANRFEFWQMDDKRVKNGIKAIISHLFSFTVKKEDSKIFGQEMARMSLLDPWGNEMAMICFPDAWEAAKDRIKELSNGKKVLAPGMAIYFKGQFQWENSHTCSLILSDIIEYKSSPELPKDLKSKKVKMARTKLTKEDILDLSNEKFVEVLEDVMIDDGILSIDDDYNDPFGEENF
jgi:hypothetical protein